MGRNKDAGNELLQKAYETGVDSVAGYRVRLSSGGLVMTRDQTGERVAVIETQMVEVGKKLDTIIANQIAGSADRAEMKHEIATLQKAVDDMKPDVQTVRLAKNFWKVAGYVSGIAAAVASFVWWAKDWIIGVGK